MRCVTDIQNQLPVQNADFFVRTESDRQRVEDFTRGQGQRNHAIMFTLTPETEGNFSCQNPTTNEFSEELLLAAYPESSPSQTQYMYIFTEETARLNCSTQPGQARTLYSAEWNRNNIRIVNTTFSLSVPVKNVSQNGTVYQCTVAVQSCSPVSSGRCEAASRTVVGDSITLVVGEPLRLTQDVQNQNVTRAESANFTCRARGTNISLSWQIDENVYRDCSNQTFCVNTTSGDSSVSSILTINTAQLRDTTVHCVLEQVFGGQTNSSISTGQLTVRAPPPSPSTPNTPNTCLLYTSDAADE